MKLTGIFFISAEELLDLVTDFTIRNLDIILGLTIISHKREKTVVRNVELKQQLASDSADLSWF